MKTTVKDDLSNIEIFPNNAIRTVNKNNKIYLIVNPTQVLKQNMFSTDGYLDLVSKYEKQGWKFHSVVSGNLYFYKKKSLFKRFLEWIK